jgi:hypothetical protein
MKVEYEKLQSLLMVIFILAPPIEMVEEIQMIKAIRFLGWRQLSKKITSLNERPVKSMWNYPRGKSFSNFWSINSGLIVKNVVQLLIFQLPPLNMN